MEIWNHLCRWKNNKISMWKHLIFSAKIYFLTFLRFIQICRTWVVQNRGFCITVGRWLKHLWKVLVASNLCLWLTQALGMASIYPPVCGENHLYMLIQTPSWRIMSEYTSLSISLILFLLSCKVSDWEQQPVWLCMSIARHLVFEALFYLTPGEMIITIW